MYVVDVVKQTGSRMNIVLSIIAIVLSAAPAVILSHLAISSLMGEGLLASLATLFVGMVLAVTFFSVITSVFRRLGWFK
jgi:hypothetical protein